MRKYLCVFFSFALITRTGLALTYGTLARIIRDNKVQSIEQLLPLLPESYRKNYTFVYQSRSLQASAVSPEWPRIILFGDDARFIMAFTKNPNTPPVSQLEDTLETIEFIDAKATFLFRSISFAPGKNPLSLEPEVNPSRCKSCHGQDPRPNWDAYNIWPGVFGSVSRSNCDTMQEGTTELKNYLAFLAGNRKLDRYQYLSPEIFPKQNPYKCPDSPQHDFTFSNAEDTHPNAKFTDLLSDLNAKRIKRLIKESPKFPLFKYLWAGLVKGCNDVERFFPPHYVENHNFTDFNTTKQELVALAKQEFDVRLKSFLLSNTGSKANLYRVPVNFLNDGSGGQYTQLDATARIKLVADRSETSTLRWETGFTDGHWTYATPTKGPLEMFKNWSVPSVGNLNCDELAAKSIETLNSR